MKGLSKVTGGANMSKDIHALISDVAQGDMDALSELYDMLSLCIFNYARTITKNKELAEDITHDVFLQINKEAMRISKVTDPAAYIMVITRNHAYNLIKRGNRAAFADEISEISDGSSPYDRLLFEDAFSTLPANQRETVHLHLISGYTLKEIAQLQNTPLVTVKWRYGKALSRLREYFTQGEQEKKKEENCNGTI
jgi:RNA polymerase sigma-70 factor (ECF subfamily)